MDLLPQELCTVIISLLSDKTKRQMRLANTKWFNIMKYNNFKLYFTRPEDIPAITERLSKYSWPIKLEFEKPKFTDALDLLEYLPKLTNLVELNYDILGAGQSYYSIYRVETNRVTSDHWMRLSVLTNLRVWTPMPDIAPPELWMYLSNLTSWSLSKTPEVLARMNKLLDMDLDAYTDNTWPFALVPVPENLTSLQMTAVEEISHGAEVWQRLTNLRDLLFANESEVDITIDLQYLTALRRLNIDNNSLPSLATNTNLTHLVISCKNWPQSSAESLCNLEKIEELEILPCKDWPAKLGFLSKLTKLNKLKLRLKTYPAEVIANFCQLIPQSVKSIDSNILTDIAHLSHLVDLEWLAIWDYSTNNNYLTVFSNLTHLSTTQRSTSDFGPISSLTRLQELSLVASESDNFPDLENLVYLTKLECQLKENPSSDKFSTLTQLQYFSTSDLLENYNFLSGLTNLTNLRIDTRKQHDITSLWNSLTLLTNLQDLTVPSLTNDTCCLSLTCLNNLTCLYGIGIGSDFTGSQLTALTSVQAIFSDCNYANYLIPVEEIAPRMPYLLKFGM